MSDVVPNEGSTFYVPEVPENVKEAERAEKLRASQSAPFLQQVTEWLEAEAKKCDSIKYAEEVALAKGVSVDTARVALSVMHDIITDQLRDYADLKKLLKR